MDYQQKYLKYKEKYNNLKKQYGSGIQLDKLKTPAFKFSVKNLDNLSKEHKLYPSRNPKSTLNSLVIRINNLFNNEQLEKELEKLSSEEIDEIRRIEDVDVLYNAYQIISDTITVELISGLKKLFTDEVIIKKSCSVEEFMTIENSKELCDNKTLVNGSCSFPDFFENDSIKEINPNNELIIEFFDLLMKLNKGEKVKIILGSRKIDQDGINITFDKREIFDNVYTKTYKIDKFINKLKCGILNRVYHIDNYFPLNTVGTNKLVLDKILEMTKYFQVIMINKMCGTCQRSLYYLVKNAVSNLSYVVDPEQKLTSEDTEQIIKCFK